MTPSPESFSRTSYHEDRPWGSFDQFALNEPCTVKILTVAPGKPHSLQFHHKRDEFWRVVAGDGVVRIGDTEHACTVGDEFLIPKGTLHRLTGGSKELVVLELSFGEFDEEDIVRVEDVFGRA